MAKGYDFQLIVPVKPINLFAVKLLMIKSILIETCNWCRGEYIFRMDQFQHPLSMPYLAFIYLYVHTFLYNSVTSQCQRSGGPHFQI